MIQRIQTAYLVVGALALLALFFFDSIWTVPGVELAGWFPPALVTLIVLTAAAAAGAVFLYKDRRRQRSAVVGVQVLTIGTMLVLYGGLYLNGGLGVRTVDGLLVGKVIALLLPIVAYLLFYLARKGIEHDIALVRSMDRLR